MSTLPSVNLTAAPLVAGLKERADALRVGVSRMEDGTCVVDAGIDHPGGIEAGLLIARICMGGLGDAALRSNPVFPDWPWQVEVRTSQPVLACLGAQYAGWSLSFDAPEKFSALGSGPARALAVREPLFEELGYRDHAGSACLVLETDRYPPPALAEKVSRDCGVAPEQMTLVLTPTGSLAGGVQIAARVVEVALHKAHEIGFPLAAIVDGAGSTPLPPPIDDPLAAMGRTNDTILFGGRVQLFVSCADEQAEDLASRLPSSSSKDYGKPFAEVFRDYGYDFFQIDPMLFSPARVAVTALGSGRTFHAGRLDGELLERSFGGGA
jgi:methenyltetrahydromethanopterin cyclohydrolase